MNSKYIILNSLVKELKDCEIKKHNIIKALNKEIYEDSSLLNVDRQLLDMAIKVYCIPDCTATFSKCIRIAYENHMGRTIPEMFKGDFKHE